KVGRRVGRQLRGPHQRRSAHKGKKHPRKLTTENTENTEKKKGSGSSHDGRSRTPIRSSVFSVFSVVKLAAHDCLGGLLPQLALEHFAGWCAREHVGEQDMLGLLVIGQLALDPGAELVGGCSRPGPPDHT